MKTKLGLILLVSLFSLLLPLSAQAQDDCPGARGPSFRIGDHFIVPYGDGPSGLFSKPNSIPKVKSIPEGEGGVILGGPKCIIGAQEGNLYSWYAQADTGEKGWISEGYDHSPVAWIAPVEQDEVPQEPKVIPTEPKSIPTQAIVTERPTSTPTKVPSDNRGDDTVPQNFFLWAVIAFCFFIVSNRASKALDKVIEKSIGDSLGRNVALVLLFSGIAFVAALLITHSIALALIALVTTGIGTGATVLST